MDISLPPAVTNRRWRARRAGRPVTAGTAGPGSHLPVQVRKALGPPGQAGPAGVGHAAQTSPGRYPACFSRAN